MNDHKLIGRLTADPVYNPEAGQKKIPLTKFAMAVKRPFASKDVDFFDIVSFSSLATSAANNLGKGRLVAVSGRGQIRTYEKDGHKFKVYEIIANEIEFLDWPDDRGQNNSTPADDVPF